MVMSDNSDLGWGCQSSAGHLDHGRWSPAILLPHFYARELMGLRLPFLSRYSWLSHLAHQFEKAYQVAVGCVLSGGSANSKVLLGVSSFFVSQVFSCCLLLAIQYVLGWEEGAVANEGASEL